MWEMCTGKVVPPQRPDLVLPSDIPHVELCVFVCDRLDVEADGGDGGDVLVELEFVEDGCAASVVPPLPATGNMAGRGVDALVLPAASRPSMSRRISFVPKILLIIFDMLPPIAPAVGALARCACFIRGAGWCGQGRVLRVARCRMSAARLKLVVARGSWGWARDWRVRTSDAMDCRLERRGQGVSRVYRCDVCRLAPRGKWRLR